MLHHIMIEISLLRKKIALHFILRHRRKKKLQEISIKKAPSRTQFEATNDVYFLHFSFSKSIPFCGIINDFFFVLNHSTSKQSLCIHKRYDGEELSVYKKCSFLPRTADGFLLFIFSCFYYCVPRFTMLHKNSAQISPVSFSYSYRFAFQLIAHFFLLLR